MALVALYHVHHAIDMRRFPALHVRDRFLAVKESVGFEIGLVHHVDSIFVAKVIEIIGLWVVRIAHMVAVGALELHHIKLDQIVRRVMSVHRRSLVTIRAAQLHRLTVDQERTVALFRRIAYLHLAETELERNGFGRNAVLLQRDYKRIEVRRLRAPQAWMVKDERRFRSNLATERNCLAGIVKHRHGNLVRRIAFHVDRKIKIPVSIVCAFRRRSGSVLNIPDMRYGRAVEPHAPRDATHQQHVLRFEIGTVAESINLKGDSVPSRLHK